MADLTPRHRSTKLLSAAAPAGVLAVAALVLLSGATNGGQTLSQVDVIEAAHADVLALRGEYEAAAAEIDEQVRYGSHVLGWMLEVEIGGTAELLDGLEIMTDWVDVRPRGALSHLSETGGSSVLGIELAARLDRLYRDALTATETGSTAREAFSLQLDTHLDPGVWHAQFGVGPNPMTAVDYGTALRALRETPVPGTLRHLLRSLEARSAALREVAAATGPILASLEAARR